MCKLSYEEVKFVEVQDWDKLVESVYKRPYSFQQQYGCQERGIYRFSTDDIIPVSEMQDYYSNEIPEEVNGEEMGVSFEA